MTEERGRPFQYLRLMSLGVIGGLLKEVHFLSKLLYYTFKKIYTLTSRIIKIAKHQQPIMKMIFDGLPALLVFKEIRWICLVTDCIYKYKMLYYDLMYKVCLNVTTKYTSKSSLLCRLMILLQRILFIICFNQDFSLCAYVA